LKPLLAYLISLLLCLVLSVPVYGQGPANDTLSRRTTTQTTDTSKRRAPVQLKDTTRRRGPVNIPDSLRAGLNTADTIINTIKPKFILSIDLSCDSFMANCDSMQAASDPCFAEFMNQKRWDEDCRNGAITCIVTIKAIPIVVDQSLIHPRRTDNYRLWLFLLLSFQFIVVVYLRVAFYKQLEDTVRAYFNINISQQIFREQEMSQPFSAFLLNINFIISSTIYVYLVVSHMLHIPGRGTLWMLGAILLLIAGIYLGKYLLMRLTAWIFPFKEEMNFYAFNFFVNQKLLGVVLIPFNFMVAYSPDKMVLPVIIASLIIISTAFLIRSIRGLLIAKNYLANYKFYFFVYICTLEIAPVLIIIKLVTKGVL
jgi:hypothetical protein